MTNKMGGSESKTVDVKQEYLFNEEEREKIANLFCSISHGKKSFNKEQFQHFTCNILDSFTSSRLFDLILEPMSQHSEHRHHHRPHFPHHHHHSHSAGEVQLPSFASHLGVLLKGDVTQQAWLCVYLASTSPHSVSAQDLVNFVSNILRSYEHILSAHCTAYQSWIFAPSADSHENLAKSLLSDLLLSDKKMKGLCVPEVDHTQSISESDVEEWFVRCSLFHQVLNQVFHGAFQFYGQSMTFIPRVPQVRDTNWSKSRTFLDFPMVLFLNFALFPALQTMWKLLFSSAVHGNSFSQLIQSIRDKGPTYLVVRDKNGHVFGGFASMSWDINSKFTGNSSCYLFKVKPNFCAYMPTGYNENFMYLNQNVKTLPNGLGMGGQLEYFGLWIDKSFESGHSKAGSNGCTTFGSPQLSGQPEFQVDAIEVWAVGRNKREEEEEDEADSAEGEKSILDKMSSADKAILDMVDRGTISDAIREEPIVEETAAHNTVISPF